MNKQTNQNQNQNKIKQTCQMDDVRCEHVFESSSPKQDHLLACKHLSKTEKKTCLENRTASPNATLKSCVSADRQQHQQQQLSVPEQNQCPLPTYRYLKATISLSSLPQMRLSKKRERKWERESIASRWLNDQPNNHNQRERDREIFLKLSAQNQSDNS